MSESKYPPGWDAERVRRLIDHDEHISEDELIAEDEAATTTREGQVVISVPEALLPEIRRLIAAHSTA
jgi:hypothetical protein